MTDERTPDEAAAPGREVWTPPRLETLSVEASDADLQPGMDSLEFGDQPSL
jgi:hypothetical protein